MMDVTNMEAKLAGGAFNVNVVRQTSKLAGRIWASSKVDESVETRVPKTAPRRRKRQIDAKVGMPSILAARH